MDARPDSARQPLPALTGARFFAAFAVVVFHYGRDSLRVVSPALATAAGAGPAAVSFFYVLSGAVLTWGYVGEAGLPTRDTRTFWVARAARILPAYLLALLLSFEPFALHTWKLHPDLGGLLRVSLGALACGLLVQAFVPSLAASLNTPGWSVSCEAFFYVLWPRLVIGLRRKQRGFPLGSVAVLWLLALLTPMLGIAALGAGRIPIGPYPTLAEDVDGAELLARALAYLPPLRVPEFGIGIILGHALKQTSRRERPVAVDTAREALLVGALFASGWALGAGVVGRATGIALSNRILSESAVLAPLFAAMVWQLARGRGLLQQFLSRAPLLALGEASYAVYVLQEPILVWISAILKRVSPALASRAELLFWVYAALLCATSLAVHRFIETPLRARISARFRPQTA